MITINYNGKTYTTKEYTQGDTIIGAHVRNWIKKGFLEEVKENKEAEESLAKKLNKPFDPKNRLIKLTAEEFVTISKGNKDSILKKLRADITDMKKEYENKLSTKKITKQTEDDKILMIRINELDIVSLILTSLEKEEPQPQEDIELLPAYEPRAEDMSHDSQHLTQQNGN